MGRLYIFCVKGKNCKGDGFHPPPSPYRVKYMYSNNMGEKLFSWMKKNDDNVLY